MTTIFCRLQLSAKSVALRSVLAAIFCARSRVVYFSDHVFSDSILYSYLYFRMTVFVLVSVKEISTLWGMICNIINQIKTKGVNTVIMHCICIPSRLPKSLFWHKPSQMELETRWHRKPPSMQKSSR